mmetsp:Transcript_2329/g.8331  ORF Transcript_2329/g.8331 Transcript_2329/m.8331 type:complete len:239 (+) Transcript_2329:3818-4534(+)
MEKAFMGRRLQEPGQEGVPSVQGGSGVQRDLPAAPNAGTFAASAPTGPAARTRAPANCQPKGTRDPEKARAAGPSADPAAGAGATRRAPTASGHPKGVPGRGLRSRHLAIECTWDISPGSNCPGGTNCRRTSNPEPDAYSRRTTREHSRPISGRAQRSESTTTTATPTSARDANRKSCQPCPTAAGPSSAHVAASGEPALESAGPSGPPNHGMDSQLVPEQGVQTRRTASGAAAKGSR